MSVNLESLNTTSLHAAQRAFEHWRHTRTRRSSTPRGLRVQAVSLIGEHRRAHICTALRINDQALKQWEREVTDSDGAQRIEPPYRQLANAKGAFIELPTHTAPTRGGAVDGGLMTAIQIDLPNGAVIRTDQVFTLEQVLSAACVSSEPGA